MSSDAGDNYVSVDFEVFGNVQGVYLKRGDISSRHASKNRRAFIYIKAFRLLCIHMYWYSMSIILCYKVFSVEK